MSTLLRTVLLMLMVFIIGACKSKSAPEQVAESVADDKQGGTGTRAKGEESSMGAPRYAKGKAGGAARARPGPRPNTESYDAVKDIGFKMVGNAPLSTFSVDTDTASYANVRRMLNQGQKPPAGAVRIEELVNYFSYDYPPPTSAVPFSTHIEVAPCPWDARHLIARIGLKGKAVDRQDREPANLVFLLDVSGSMSSPKKLPLLKRALKLAVNQLSDRDRVAIVVYAGASGLVLPSTPFDDRPKILDALEQLKAGGSTNAGSGIQLAYQVAQDNFIKGGINRVILATDGDFNVGVTNKSDLVKLVEDKAKGGVFLTVLGLGMGNLKDDMLEKLADRGNGNYAYIDSFAEARKVFSEQISGTLVTIAKDVKIQVEFNPAKVKAYRLIGYENRMLAAEDFNDDKKDAGEIGAGHTVTALYQIVPVGKEVGYGTGKVDDLKYAEPAKPKAGSATSELMTVKLRYKEPAEDESKKLEFVVKDAGKSFEEASEDFRFAVAVAGFGMLLRDSKYKADLSYDHVAAWADAARSSDKREYRALFVQLVRKAKEVTAKNQ
jgi:Ca-activated chloride channel homolog